MKPLSKYIILILLILPLISPGFYGFELFLNSSNKIVEEKNYPILSDVVVGNYTVPGITGSLSLDQIIKIGVLDDLNRTSGEHARNGALLAAKEINLAGGIDINGSQYYVGIVAENTDEENPILDVPKAIAAAERMVSLHDPYFIIGGSRTEAVLQYLEVIMDNHIPFMGTGCATDIFCLNVLTNYNRYKYFFRVMPLNSSSNAREFLSYLDILAEFLGAEYSGTVDKVAILREDLSWTTSLSAALNTYLPSFGLTVMVEIAFPITATTTDFMAYMSQIQASGAQILIPIISAQGGIIMNMVYENVKPKCLIAGIDKFAGFRSYWDDTGGACQYEVIIQNVFRTNKTALTIPFWDAYLSEYGEEPFYMGVGAYDAVRLLVNAVNSSQSLLPNAVIAQLETITTSNPFMSANGNIAFTPSHDLFEGWPYSTCTFCQWQSGGIKQVVPTYSMIYPNSIATAPLIIPYWGINSLTGELYPPGDFTLTTDADDPEVDGNFILNWTESEGAYSYSLYSSNTPITSLNRNLNLLTHQYDNASYKLTNFKTGDYYFIAVSYNTSGEALSNSIYVNVSRPTPGPFILTSNANDPDTDGIFNLSWTSSEGADNYSIYKHTGPITEINETIDVLTYQNAISPFLITETEEGIYYYIIEAVNASGMTLSNFIFINVNLLPEAFVLTSNAGNPDDDGNFNLTWMESLRANNYSAYCHSGYITEINESVTLLANKTTDISFPLNGYLDGTYYFIVVAHNDYGDTISNCIKIDIEITKTLTILSPNASSSWELGTAQYINWTSTGSISNVKIELYNNGAFVMEIIESAPNNGEFYWFVSSGLMDSAYYRIKIIDASVPSVFDYSDHFEIKTSISPPQIIPGYDIILLLGTAGLIGIYTTKKKLVVRLR